MMYQPEGFYEAESVGPAVTFGDAPAVTHEAAQAQAQAEFRAKFGHDVPQNYSEADWLDERVKAIKLESGVSKVMEVTTPAGDTRTVHVTQQHIDPGWWGGMTTGGKTAVAAGGIIGVGALVMLGRRRRTNPRRRGAMMPLLLIGGVAAALIWGGKKTVETIEEVVPVP